MGDKYGRGWGYKRWGAPPEGYVPGLGRGAVGFVTRSDVGPLKIGQNEDPPAPNDAKYDKWSGHD